MNKYLTNSPVLITPHSNKKVEFIDVYEKEKFKQSLKKFGEEWYYSKNKITYNNNQHGYRCKEIEDVEAGFLLTFGCSNTYGVGLLEEDTWSYKLSKELDLDLINLGTPGTGPEFVFYNTVKFSKYCKNRNITPSVVCVQWSYDDRAGYWHQYEEDIEYRIFDYTQPPTKFDNNDYGARSEVGWFFNAFTEFEVKKINNKVFYPLAVNQIWEGLGAKVINFTIDSGGIKQTFFNEPLPYPNLNIEAPPDLLDVARDEGHPGVLNNNYIKEVLTNKIKNG